MADNRYNFIPCSVYILEELTHFLSFILIKLSYNEDHGEAHKSFYSYCLSWLHDENIINKKDVLHIPKFPLILHAKPHVRGIG